MPPSTPETWADVPPPVEAQVEQRMVELLENVPNGETCVLDDFDPRSLLSKSLRDCEDQNPNSTRFEADNPTLEPSSSVDTADTSDVKAARSRARALGDGLTRCAAGPWYHRAGDGPEGRTARLACLRYGCSICGPRVKVVLQASAEVVVSRVVEKGMWKAVVVENLPKAGKTALTRWASEVEPELPEDEADHSRRLRLISEASPPRLHITIATSPTNTTTLVMWKDTEDNAPAGALSRHLIRSAAAADPRAKIGEMVAAVDLVEWACAADDDGVRTRATVLRGCRYLTERIAEVRDAVLGRSRAKHKGKEKAPGWSLRTYRRGGGDVRDEVARRLETTVLADEPEQHRGGTRVEHWRATDGTPVRMALEEMERDGWFKGIERYRGPLDDPSAKMPLLTDLLGDEQVEFMLMDFTGKKVRFQAA
jgi:hypothetical protein